MFSEFSVKRSSAPLVDTCELTNSAVRLDGKEFELQNVARLNENYVKRISKPRSSPPPIVLADNTRELAQA